MPKTNKKPRAIAWGFSSIPKHFPYTPLAGIIFALDIERSNMRKLAMWVTPLVIMGLVMGIVACGGTGLGSRVRVGDWDVIVERVHVEESLGWTDPRSRRRRTFSPDEGYVFLVADVTLENHGTSSRIRVKDEDFAIVGRSERVFEVAGQEVTAGNYLLGGFDNTLTLPEGSDRVVELSLFFTIDEESRSESLDFRFKDESVVALTVR